MVSHFYKSLPLLLSVETGKPVLLFLMQTHQSFRLEQCKTIKYFFFNVKSQNILYRKITPKYRCLKSLKPTSFVEFKSSSHLIQRFHVKEDKRNTHYIELFIGVRLLTQFLHVVDNIELLVKILFTQLFCFVLCERPTIIHSMKQRVPNKMSLQFQVYCSRFRIQSVTYFHRPCTGHN